MAAKIDGVIVQLYDNDKEVIELILDSISNEAKFHGSYKTIFELQDELKDDEIMIEISDIIHGYFLNKDDLLVDQIYDYDNYKITLELSIF